ncbi:MAG: RNA recognition motif domain-containing protein [Opitutaceae bacterium]
MKLLIRNLNRLTTAEELKKIFQEFGTVQSCIVVMDKKSGESKGFAFMEMPKAGEAKAAVKNLNSKMVGGNRIRVKKAEVKKKEARSSENTDKQGF